MNDGDALLAAINANPEEDTPRLMYADWLDGQPGDYPECWWCDGKGVLPGTAGDKHNPTCDTCGGSGRVFDRWRAAWAEFIRVQCELATRKPVGVETRPITSDRYGDLPVEHVVTGYKWSRETHQLQERERQLLMKIPGRVFGRQPWDPEYDFHPHDNRPLWCDFKVQRGFLDEVTVPPEILVGGACPDCVGGRRGEAPNPQFTRSCRRCGGTGSLHAPNGYARDLARFPLTRVRLYGKAPSWLRKKSRWSRTSTWFVQGAFSGVIRPDRSDMLPPELFPGTPGRRRANYAAAEEAVAAAEAKALEYVRSFR